MNNHSFSFMLNTLEEHLRKLFEGNSNTPRSIQDLASVIAENIVRETTDNWNDSTAEDQSTFQTPQKIEIFMNPDLGRELDSNRGFLLQIHLELEKAYSNKGIKLSQPPELKIKKDSTLDLYQFRIEVLDPELLDLSGTSILESLKQNRDHSIQVGAFLMMADQSLFEINQLHVRIGRNSDNDLVIPNSRVSRNHAVIRQVNGRYSVFDLESTGGTMVNQKNVIQQELESGDVISLGGFDMVFGQEMKAADSTQQIDSEKQK